MGYYGNTNLYTYVDNNPVNWVDPLGLCKDGAPGGIFPKGQWPAPPDTTPEPPKAEEKPKKNIPDDPTPEDPSPREPTTEEPKWVEPAEILYNMGEIIKALKNLIKGGGGLPKGPLFIIPKPVLEKFMGGGGIA